MVSKTDGYRLLNGYASLCIAYGWQILLFRELNTFNGFMLWCGLNMLAMLHTVAEFEHRPQPFVLLRQALVMPVWFVVLAYRKVVNGSFADPKSGDQQ